MYASVQNWKLAEIFFTKDRMEPEEDTKKSNFTGKKKQTNKRTKKPQEFVWNFIEKHMKIHEKPRPATKEDKYCFFMIAKPLADR